MSVVQAARASHVAPELAEQSPSDWLAMYRAAMGDGRRATGEAA
jgi:hypothetical protein